MTLNHIIPVVVIFLIAPQYVQLVRDSPIKCCPDNIKNGSSCITCQNTTTCCTNQPYTLNFGNSPYCCNIGQECCGSSCCRSGQVCCFGRKLASPVCCSSCDNDGGCQEEHGRPAWYKSFWVIIAGIAIIFIPFCICIVRRMRSSRRRNQTSQQRIAQLLANSRSIQYPIPSDDQLIFPQAVVYPPPTSFYGIPPHFLENFPIYVYETTPSQAADAKTTEVDPLISENVDDSRVCIICLDTYARGERIRLLPCVHRFHVDCIDQWLKKHTTCPLCKLDLITQEFQ